jgi:hypothetical protein
MGALFEFLKGSLQAPRSIAGRVRPSAGPLVRSSGRPVPRAIRAQQVLESGKRGHSWLLGHFF